jgi:hypothetical protein
MPPYARDADLRNSSRKEGERERAHLHFRKFRKVRSVFYFRKLNKIAKGGLKI